VGSKFRLIACEASSAARTLFGKLRLGLVGISVESYFDKPPGCF
jgi:hypothetical protein